MAKSKGARKLLEKAPLGLQRVSLLSMFLVPLGAALTATWANGPMPQMKGAWVTQATR